MRIGIISLYYNSKNIGGLLQSYAMVYMLEKLGYDVEQISYDPSKTNDKIVNYLAERRRALLKYSSFRTIVKKFLDIIYYRLNKTPESIQKKIKCQDKVFLEFENFIPHSSVVYDESNISEANNVYDIFLVGSDQVWNTCMLMRDAYYLTFTSKKRIAYAVSMGKSELIDLEVELFKEKLRSFKNVSVREKTLGMLIESISEVNCTCVLDPTLLLHYEDWRTIENNIVLPSQRFVFCYFLGDCSWQRKKVQQYAEKYNLLVIDLPYIMKTIRKSDGFLKGKHFNNVGPREFISLIENADCVFTDSFHAVAFSVNFQTNFYVFDRDGLSGSKSINSRITDFLDLLFLSDRRVTSQKTEITNDSIEWSKVSTILEEQRQRSKDWLQKQLLSREE